MKRCKSTGSVVTMKSPSVASSGGGGGSSRHQHQQTKSGGIPWRTAARANRYRISNCAYRKLTDQEEMMYEDEAAEMDEFDDEDEHLQNIINNLDINEKIAAVGVAPVGPSLTRMKTNRSYDDLAANQSSRFNHLSSTFDTEKFAGMRQQQQHQQGGGRSGANNFAKESQQQRRTLANNESLVAHNKSEFVSSLDKIKNASVKDYLVILQKEQESKAQLEDMLIGVSYFHV
jgi:hypothetical protein